MNVSIEQAQQSLSALIDQLRPDQKVIITRNEQPVAQLVPITVGKPKPVFGSSKGMATIVADDDEHLRDFEDYMP